MPSTSNSARGAAWKARSKKWLQAQGLSVADMELVRTVHTPNGTFPTKRDQFGSDLLYLADDVVVFVQVKGGGKPMSTLVLEAQRAFDEQVFPLHSRRELHVWRPRARAPEIKTWTGRGLRHDE